MVEAQRLRKNSKEQAIEASICRQTRTLARPVVVLASVLLSTNQHVQARLLLTAYVRSEIDKGVIMVQYLPQGGHRTGARDPRDNHG